VTSAADRVIFEAEIRRLEGEIMKLREGHQTCTECDAGYDNVLRAVLEDIEGKARAWKPTPWAMERIADIARAALGEEVKP